MFPNDITSICFIITSMLFQIFLLLGFSEMVDPPNYAALNTKMI